MVLWSWCMVPGGARFGVMGDGWRKWRVAKIEMAGIPPSHRHATSTITTVVDNIYTTRRPLTHHQPPHIFIHPNTMMSEVSSRRLLVDMDRRPPRGMKRSLTATILTITVAAPPMLSCAFSLVPLPLSHLPPHLGQHASARTRTTCNAKLDKIASSFDLNKILSSEKEFSSFDDDALTSGKKKNKLKEQMRQQRQEMQQLKKKNRDKNSSRTNENILHNGRDFDDDTLDVDSRTEYENLIQNISFSAYEIPSSVDGRRIDAVLVELLNNECDDKGQTSSLSISRTQCGTLLSNKCVFVVPPEDAHIFRNALNAHYDNESDATAVPRVLIEQHCSPIQRKSHILESQSILVYPTRESLFPTSSSSSTLLSNLVPPAEIIAQKIPLDILYEDEHMIVINKQAGIVV